MTENNQTPKPQQQPQIDISQDQNIVIKKLDDDTLVATVPEESKTAFEQAMYDFESKKHLYNRYLKSESTSFITNTEELNNLAKDPQNSLSKILKINNLIRYYINKDDLTGKVCEALENNINTQYKINFPTVPKGRNKLKIKDKSEILINNFNKKIDIEKTVIKSDLTTYSEGNFITYLRDTNDGNYKIINYPLGIVEISDYEIDGEPVILFNIQELTSRLGANQNIFKNLKTPNNFPKTIDEEIKRNYPSEVYEAYKNRDTYAILDPKRVGVMRINNLNGLYGLSPVFKSINSQLMLETIDTIDKKNVLEKGKKIISQILRKEILGGEGKNTQHFDEINYAHVNLITALSQNTVVVTCPGYVEKIEIIESKQETTDINTINYYRNKVLNSLGISFLSNESKSSYNTVTVNVGELLKTINKITAQIQSVINKYYKVICELNNIPLEYCPEIQISPSEMMDNETKLKFVDLLFSKIGASYRSTFELLDMNYDEELRRREEENKYNADNIWFPHSNSFTSNSNDLLNQNTDKTPENQNKNKDKQQEDKNKNEQQT